MNSRWYFQPIFESYWVPLCFLILLVVLLWVRPVFQNLSRKRWRLLTWLRLGSIACIVLAMMRPTYVSTETQPLAATLAILVDTSRSMQTNDVGDESRWQRARELAESVFTRRDDLGEAYNIRMFSFSDGATPVDLDGAELNLPDEPEGKQTDIGAALEDVIKAEAGKRLGGIFVISDGAQRVLNPRADPGQIARQLARQNCPIYTVTLGQTRDASQIRDVSIEDFEDEYTVFAKNEIGLRATVHVQGFVGQSIPVQLEVTKPDGTVESSPVQVVSAEEDNQSIGVQFNYIPTEPGQYQLLMKAASQPGESITDNNSLGAFLQVLEGGLRVLYLCGNIGWQEHNLIRRSIDQSLDIQLDFLWVDMRRSVKWPMDISDQLENANYDVFILADVDYSALGASQCDRLAQLVEEGAGLMMTGGVHSLAAGGYGESPLNGVLPIKLNRLDRQQLRGPIREDVHLSGDIRMLPTAAHFVTQLGLPTQSKGIWEQLPPLQGANQIGWPNPTAIVLAESEQQAPLLVQGQYGLGRVLVFAGDSTYRWYRYGFQDAHKRFWRQSILWLAQKDDQRDNDVRILLDQRRFAVESQAPFQITVRDGLGESIEKARLEIELHRPLQPPTAQGDRITSTKNDMGWMGRTPMLSTPGDYKITVRAFDDNLLLGEAEARFMVLDQDLELADPTANPAQMEMLAELTSDLGGRSIAPTEVQELLDELQAKPVESTTEFQSRWQLADTQWDAWGYFVLVMALLSTEWYLRKKWAMV